MSNTRYIDKNGLSFDCPDYYDIGKYPSSDENHKAIVALSKKDRKCELYVMAYRKSKFDNNAKGNMGLLEQYLRLQNYNNITTNKNLPYCFNANVYHNIGTIKTTIVFDFNHDDVIMIVGNVAPSSSYDCNNDIKIILDSLQYDNNIIKRVKRNITTKNKAIIGILAIITIIFISSIDMMQYRNMILIPFILPAIFLVFPSEKINSSKFLAFISGIVFISLLFFNLYIDLSFAHYYYSEYFMQFILGLIISIISLFCIFIMFIPINSWNNYHCADKRGYVDLFKETILYSENNDNNKRLSKSKFISWISYLIGGYSYVNTAVNYYFLGELNLIIVFIIFGAICASIVFIILTLLDMG